MTGLFSAGAGGAAGASLKTDAKGFPGSAAGGADPGAAEGNAACTSTANWSKGLLMITMYSKVRLYEVMGGFCIVTNRSNFFSEGEKVDNVRFETQSQVNNFDRVVMNELLWKLVLKLSIDNRINQ